VISPIAIDVTVLWSVCHACVLCSYTSEDKSVSFAYDSPMSLQDRIKIWLRPTS